MDGDDHHLQQPDKSIPNPSSSASDHSSPGSSALRALPSKSAAPKVDDTLLALTTAAGAANRSPNQAPRPHPTPRHLQPHLRPALGPNLRSLPHLRQGRPHPGHAQPQARVREVCEEGVFASTTDDEFGLLFFAIEGSRSIRVSAVPHVASDEPKVERSLSMLRNLDSKGFGQVLGIYDTITTTTTCSFELHRSDKESLKVTDFKPIFVLCFGSSEMLPYSFNSSYFNSLREYINLSSYLQLDHHTMLQLKRLEENMGIGPNRISKDTNPGVFEIMSYLVQLFSRRNCSHNLTDGLVNSCAPSTLINRECEFQFANLCSEGTSINQVFAQHVRLFLVTSGNTSMEFVMGLEKWIVPIMTRSATTSDGERRNSLAAKEGDYVEASECYNYALEIRYQLLWVINCVMDSLVKTWIGTRLDRLRELVDRNLQEEGFHTTLSQSNEGYKYDYATIPFLTDVFEITDCAWKRNREVQQEKSSVGLIIYAGCCLVLPSRLSILPTIYFISFQ
ncbi:hypothetical protein RHMOL_Rhmol02G0230600 [Rhododendron molle]|uniref:Uncharacterized protein n=1 Tax=Rhododendron molle TaxID=49168 RepID=A0ACC0PUK4_RHOML|nr:hypothetical protein RHMOL_Rhmol02G0230600 [Rhododendron molle]